MKRLAWNEDDPPPKEQGWVRSPYQQADLGCIMCHKRIGILMVNQEHGTIAEVVEYLQQHGVGPLCPKCYEKLGFKIAKIPETERP